MDIYIEEDSIILQKLIPECIFCGNRDELINYNNRFICKLCLKEIQEIDYEKEREAI